MPPRIAIPMPHSTDHEYSERAIPQYERAVSLAGGEPVRILLDRRPSEVRSLIERCDGVLLPGSKADVDPGRFQQDKLTHTAAADLRREQVDDFLMEDAYAHRKPVLGICYGLQSLNVFRKGSLIQHIPDFLPQATRAKVNHEAGKKVAVGHTVEINSDSQLARIIVDGVIRQVIAQFIGDDSRLIASDKNREGHGLSRANNRHEESRASAPEGNSLVMPVNSSHHQSADTIGDGLRVVARCPDDGIIEALEGTSPDHFVIAVQWHPERSVDDDARSRLIFQALIEAALKL
jgi:putative glutamine amidotransferase